APTPTPTPTPTPPRVVPEPRLAATEPRATEPVKPAVVEPREPKEPKVAATPAKPRDAELYFAVGNAMGRANTQLARTVRWLTASPDVQVTIEGHADPTGSAENNQVLAQKRAEWVRDYLVSAGIDASRLEVISYGDTRLKYSRTDTRNRRVAIVPK
nr:OmpA family protein [Myxococcota bacterium]